jgi:four helix bundle suffix protein
MLDEFDYTDDLLHDYWTYLLGQKKKFDPWLEDRDDIAAANALIVLIQRATGLLARQLTRLEGAFVETGGIREKMTAARLESRADSAAPVCPDCGAHMKQRSSSRGPFWGCSAYPKCKGVRRIAEEEKVTP